VNAAGVSAIRFLLISVDRPPAGAIVPVRAAGEAAAGRTGNPPAGGETLVYIGALGLRLSSNNTEWRRNDTMRKLRSLVSVGLITLGALLVAAPVGAQEGTLKKIKETGAITLGHRDASIPFSYFDDKQAAIGYAMDLCGKIVDAVKAELKMPNLQVKLNPVTSATRIPLMANGTIDLECGSTTNNLERQKQVAFTITHFVTANRFVSKKAANLKTLNDLKGKTVVSTSGTTNIKQITELNGEKNLGLTILPAKDHAEAFLMVETGRAAAFVMDDILLYSLVANSKNPSEWVISADALSVEPYGIMLRKDDPSFKKVVDQAMTKVYKSGEINKIYAKWFLSPVPPKGINLNVPMSAVFKRVVAKPTDSGDPNDYK
jgi:glutamate/aspartate transport system substrate-binding protein